MRILFLAYRDPTNPFNGGGDIYISELAKGCGKSGHKVTFLASKYRGAKEQENLGNLSVIRLGSKYTMFLSIFSYYFSHLRGNFDLIVEEVMGGPRIPFFAALYMKESIIGILQQRHKEIFRQQFSKPVAVLLSQLERFLALLYRNKKLVVNSEKTKEELRAIGYKPEKMYVIYPGIPNSILNVEIPPFSKRKQQVICLTKIRRYKLVDHAIRAMDNVCKTLPGSKLVVAGKTNDVEPKYETEIRQLVKELNLSSSVSFESNISENRKVELLKSSRALVLPSAIEGFSIVVIEANAFGTPAVTSDRVPAALNGKNAVVIPCFEVDSLSKAIISLLSDQKRWSGLSSGSFEFAKQFTWDASVYKFVSLIEKIGEEATT
jgi:glycosyltransferase involved in cell wall biosynthesis